jgi:MYXO-CTERM domain-containing protein
MFLPFKHSNEIQYVAWLLHKGWYYIVKDNMEKFTKLFSVLTVTFFLGISSPIIAQTVDTVRAQTTAVDDDDDNDDDNSNWGLAGLLGLLGLLGLRKKDNDHHNRTTTTTNR